MRLINTRTLSLEHFGEDDVPPYAILSHRWEDEEISYEEMILASPTVRKRRGYLKILAFCRAAWSHGLSHGWVDTCCINKANSTELAEAISSMFAWYSKAAVCFGYLSDIQLKAVPYEYDTLLASSVWFERGWTLQELIAPAEMHFYDRDWALIGTKQQLEGLLAQITGIDKSVLGGASPQKCTIAQRMSWAANRKTSRAEDRAYSLIGIFDVSLPMIYGEGNKAFIRLQEEIIKHSDDHSIFAWSIGLPDDSHHGRCGLLAPSPSSFAYCQDVVRAGSNNSSKAFTVTNKGLSIELPTIPWSMGTYLAILDCSKISHPSKRLAILLERLSSAGQFARVRSGRMTITNVDSQIVMSQKVFYPVYRQMFIRQSITDKPRNEKYGFWLQDLDIHCFGPDELAWARIWSRDLSRPGDKVTGLVELPVSSYGTVGAVRFVPKKKVWPVHRLSWIKFGFDNDFNPICMLGNQNSLDSHFYRIADGHKTSMAIRGYYEDLQERERVLCNKWIFRESTQRNMGQETQTYCILKWDKGQTEQYVPLLNITISVKLVRYWERVNETEHAQPQAVWTIHISRVRHPLIRALSSAKDTALDNRNISGWMIVLGMIAYMELNRSDKSIHSNKTESETPRTRIK
ncbi:MAG: hypothetical protein Q9160_000702 [Pyrenula sp. 1 TL-2023]